MTVTTQQLQTGLTMIYAIAETVREAGEVPSGTIYATLAGRVTLDGYKKMLTILQAAGLITVNANHMLRWVGPTIAGRAA